MKSCPKCKSNYTDDTLIYCLQDGSVLSGQGLSETEFPTIAFGEKTEEFRNDQKTEKFAVGREPDQIRVDLEKPGEELWDQSVKTRVGILPLQKARFSTTAAVLAAIVGMLILFGISGGAAWLYYSKGKTAEPDRKAVSGNMSDSDQNDAPGTAVNKTPGVSNVSDSNSVATPRPAVDIAKRDAEISGFINSWKSASEAHDLEAHMGHYAARVDYYNKRKVGRGVVRADRQKAYDKYPSIRISLTKMSITQAANEDEVFAVFDKEWLFQNEQKDSTGKVKSQLKLKKAGAGWEIISEKDLQVYYVK